MPKTELAHDDGAPSPGPAEAPLTVSWPWAVVALVAWAILSFGHGYGLELAGAFFDWAKRPDTLGAAGHAGLARAELILASCFGAIAVGVIGSLGWRLRRLRLDVDRRKLWDAAIPWLLWATLVFLIWKCFIVYATELVHFAQYALIGFLVAWALERGRRPQLAFLITFGLGFLDEVWQHYGLHVLLKGDLHWMDWSDPVLDALGAAGGILPFVTLARLRGDVLPPSAALLRKALVVATLALAPFFVLHVASPETSSWVLGHYRWYPFWGEYENHKPTHWPNPREGIPLNLAALLVIGTLLEPRRRAMSQAGLLALAVLLALTIDPYSRLEGMPVHEVVPRAEARWADGPITVDGVLAEPAWDRAQRLGPFVRNVDGRSDFERAAGEAQPLLPTYARLLWDEEALYVAFEVTDDDVWARNTHRDDTTLPGDEVVELFLDDGGDEITYYEFEVSPAGVVYDLFNFVPTAPVDHDPYNRFIGHPTWDAPGLEAAVAVNGTLDIVENPKRRLTEARDDEGWTVELALPWEALRTTTTPSEETIRQQVHPDPGDRWRLNLHRIERPRTLPVDRAEVVAPEEARRLLGCTEETFAEEFADRLKRDDEGGLLRWHVERWAARGSDQLQSWSPTWQPSFHDPTFFGVVEFVRPNPPR